MSAISRRSLAIRVADPPPVESRSWSRPGRGCRCRRRRPTRPPAWRDSDSPQPRSRGSRYCSWASSTWALPSLLRACWAKMSRISAVRSMTLTLHDVFQLAELAGRQLAVADHGVGAGRDDDVAQLLGLARADIGGRVGPARGAGSGRRAPPSRPSRPAGRARAASSRRSASVPSVHTPIEDDPLEPQGRYSTSVTSSSSVDRPATRRSAAERVTVRRDLSVAGASAKFEVICVRMRNVMVLLGQCRALTGLLDAATPPECASIHLPITPVPHWSARACAGTPL